MAGACPNKVSPGPECVHVTGGSSRESQQNTKEIKHIYEDEAEPATQNKGREGPALGSRPTPSPRPTPGREEMWRSGVHLALPFHKGLEEATQLLGGWGPGQQPPHSLQAFLLQIPLLLPQLLPQVLPGEAEMSPGAAFGPHEGGHVVFGLTAGGRDKGPHMLLGSWL